MILLSKTKKPMTVATQSQKNFYQSSNNLSGSTRYQSSHSIPSINKHPILDVILGDDFSKIGLFKLVLEGESFGKAEITETSRFELKTLNIKRLEPMDAVLTVLQYNENKSEYETFGIKNIEIAFGKGLKSHSIRCGPSLSISLSLTVRLYL